MRRVRSRTNRVDFDRHAEAAQAFDAALRLGLGDTWGAQEDLRAALQVNPNCLDAQDAVDFVSDGG